MPNWLLADIIPVQLNSTTLTWYRCTISIKDKTDKTLLFAFRIFILSAFLFVIIAKRKYKRTDAPSLDTLLSDCQIHYATNENYEEKILVNKSSHSQLSCNPISQRTSGKHDREGKKSFFLSRCWQEESQKTIYSYMLMTITITTVISYIVPLAFTLLSSGSGSNVEISLKTFISKRLYILCHVVNPFIYGAFVILSELICETLLKFHCYEMMLVGWNSRLKSQSTIFHIYLWRCYSTQFPRKESPRNFGPG